MNRSYFAIEGVDGCGKSSVIRELAKKKTMKGRPILPTKEVFLKPIWEICKKDVKTWTASRYSHFAVAFLDCPLNTIVIYDRYRHSTLVYNYDSPMEQSSLDLMFEESRFKKYVKKLPDVTSIIIDVDPELAKQRLIDREGEGIKETDEYKLIDKHVDRYRQLVSSNEVDYVVDGSMTLEMVVRECENIILNNIN